jgi:hypothetical protein
MGSGITGKMCILQVYIMEISTFWDITSVAFQWITQRYVQEERTLHNNRCENSTNVQNSSIESFGVDIQRCGKVTVSLNCRPRVVSVIKLFPAIILQQ